MAKRGSSIDMSDERFEDFLTRLASDDELRDAMKRDPAATLAGAGIYVPKESMPVKVTLPPKKAFKAQIGGYIQRKRESKLAHFPHGLVGGICAGDDAKPKAKAKPKPKARAKPKPSKPKGRK